MQAWPFPELPRLPGEGPEVLVRDTSSRGLVPAVARPTWGTASGLGPGIAPRTARIYVCGITPYDATHMGHANTYVAFDLLGRALRDGGVAVRYVQNVTDVDDPLLERAAATGQDWRALAERETELFREDMTALRVLPPESYVGAVESIPLIGEFIAELRARGAAYSLEVEGALAGDAADGEGHAGDWYFPVSADPAFGAVAGLDAATMLRLLAERGGDPARPGKKDPLDALLWRAARPGEPSWESPVGPGRPGWHVECTAIALDRLGESIDVMGGGSDLAFPHHEMGASHAHVRTGVAPFVRAFMHAGMVGYQGEKMSKSRGNLVFVSALRRAGVDPAAIRLALLAQRYSTDWEWTDAVLATATRRLAAWRAAVSRPDGPEADATLAAVRAALADDLDAPAALAAVDAWVEQARAGHGTDPGGPGVLSRLADGLLGIAL